MDAYVLYFALLACTAAVLARHLRQQRAAGQEPDTHSSIPPDEKLEDEDSQHASQGLLDPVTGGAISHSSQLRAAKFRDAYFTVYTLVLAADWLQGPYIYSVYHKDHQLPENTIAVLFGAGFISAGVSSSFLGTLADRYGRRNACWGYCVVTTLSCLSVLVDKNLPMLFLGRIMGGLSSTLLYSVFEAWMVSEYKARDLSTSLSLDDMFSWSSTLSGVVAITAGVVGESLVSYTGSRASPFILAVGLLCLAAIAIIRYWNENYGQTGTHNAARDDEEKFDVQYDSGLAANLYRLTAENNLRLVVLGLTTTAFEGSMYLFVFFWTPTLTSCREDSAAHGSWRQSLSPSRGNSAVEGSLPLGLIFGSFMCAMMIGSMVFSLHNKPNTQPTGSLVCVLAVAASSLLIPVITQSETWTFWAFVLFEVMVGVYYPIMGKLKSELVQDSARAKVYTWLRLPLNLFVCITLGVTREGSNFRSMVFHVLGGLLLATALVVKRQLVTK